MITNININEKQLGKQFDNCFLLKIPNKKQYVFIPNKFLRSNGHSGYYSVGLIDDWVYTKYKSGLKMNGYDLIAKFNTDEKEIVVHIPEKITAKEEHADDSLIR